MNEFVLEIRTDNLQARIVALGPVPEFNKPDEIKRHKATGQPIYEVVFVISQPAFGILKSQHVGEVDIAVNTEVKIGKMWGAPYQDGFRQIVKIWVSDLAPVPATTVREAPAATAPTRSREAQS